MGGKNRTAFRVRHSRAEVRVRRWSGGGLFSLAGSDGVLQGEVGRDEDQGEAGEGREGGVEVTAGTFGVTSQYLGRLTGIQAGVEVGQEVHYAAGGEGQEA